MHHEKPHGNYGIYFNFWDRWMGTNHKDYDRRLEEVTQRPKEPERLSHARVRSPLLF